MITRTAGRRIEKLAKYAWRLGCAGAAFCCFSQPTIALGQAAGTEALAQVGERIITREAFEAFKAPIIALTTEGAQTDSAMLRSFVDKTLLLMEASSVGPGEDPVIVEQIEAFKKIQIVKAYKSLLVNRTITVTEEELLDHLQATDRDRDAPGEPPCQQVDSARARPSWIHRSAANCRPPAMVEHSPEPFGARRTQIPTRL